MGSDPVFRTLHFPGLTLTDFIIAILSVNPARCLGLRSPMDYYLIVLHNLLQEANGPRAEHWHCLPITLVTLLERRDCPLPGAHWALQPTLEFMVLWRGD